MSADKITLNELAARIPPHLAQMAVAQIYATIGMEDEWDSETIEHVLDCLGDIHPHMGFTDLDNNGPSEAIPNPYSQEPGVAEFWITIEED